MADLTIEHTKRILQWNTIALTAFRKFGREILKSLCQKLKLYVPSTAKRNRAEPTKTNYKNALLNSVSQCCQIDMLKWTYSDFRWWVCVKIVPPILRWVLRRWCTIHGTCLWTLSWLTKTSWAAIQLKSVKICKVSLQFPVAYSAYDSSKSQKTGVTDKKLMSSAMAMETLTLSQSFRSFTWMEKLS